MKRYKVLLVVLVVSLLGTTVLAQQPAPSPSQEQPREVTAQRALEAQVQAQMQALQAQLQAIQAVQDPNAPAGQRSGRGRGAGPGTSDGLNGTRGGIVSPNPANTIVSNGRGLLISPNSGAWWTNIALMARIGLTDDQRLRIERAFENHRQSLTSSKELLEREETQLARLLDAEQVDRASVTAQISKVVLARGDMEKVNALMTLEMREVLTRAQWTQLQVQQTVNVNVGLEVVRGAGPGLRSGGPGTGAGGIGAGTRGARGQQPPTP